MRRVNKLKPRDGGIISGLPEERHGCAPKRGSPRAYPQNPLQNSRPWIAEGSDHVRTVPSPAGPSFLGLV